MVSTERVAGSQGQCSWGVDGISQELDTLTLLTGTLAIIANILASRLVYSRFGCVRKCEN